MKFRCRCGRKIPASALISVIKDNKSIACSMCKKVWNRDSMFDEGVDCPCCGGLLKQYHRHMGSTISRWLVAFYRVRKRTGAEWIHTSEPSKLMGGKAASSRSGDYAKARFWKLIEPKPKDEDDDPDKKSSGFWRLTERGEAFVENKLQVQKTAIVFNNEVTGFEGDPIGIIDALGTKFSYPELMGTATRSA
jgi:hypothetical protein